MEFGNKMVELRKKMGLSQEELAEKVGVARQTISKWELGDSSPDLLQAKELSKIFKVSLDELVGNDIENILVNKISNTEKLAGMIIKILKVIGIILIVGIIGFITIFMTLKYYEVRPNNMVAESVGLNCTINGKKEYFQAERSKDNNWKIELTGSNEEIIKGMNIKVDNYKSLEKLINSVKKYIRSHGGKCDGR